MMRTTNPATTAHAIESRWHVLRRCLVIVCRAQQGDATKSALLTAVYQTLGDDAYGNTTGKLLDKRFHRDCALIRERLNIALNYEKGQGYVIREWGTPLFDLSSANIETLAHLATLFTDDSPQSQQVGHLINQLYQRLAPDRQNLFDQTTKGGADVDLRLRDNDTITEDVWETIRAGERQGRELSFLYVSPRNEPEVERYHHVQPWHVYFDERNHYYLRGYCLEADGEDGRIPINAYVRYRIGRIVPHSVKLLPRKLPATPPLGQKHEVIFEVAPEIGRMGVSRRPELLDDPTLIPVDDGWTRVEGYTDDDGLWQLARNLLYYGDKCHVLGGDKLKREFIALVRGLADVYNNE